jgi:hypothetical protein
MRQSRDHHRSICKRKDDEHDNMPPGMGGDIMDGGHIVPRKTITQIVSYREQALREFNEAFDRLNDASDALMKARITRTLAAPTQESSYNTHSKRAEQFFLTGMSLPKRDEFMTLAQRLVDTDVWAHVIELMGLETILDKKAKDQLRDSLMKEPPEVTEDNIRATVEQWVLSSGEFFRRGIAEAFSRLDRRFKSHDGWKIGGRVVLTRVFSEFGSWSSYNMRDTLLDIERVFYKLDGLDQPSMYVKRDPKLLPEEQPEVGIIEAIDDGRRDGGYQARQSTAETRYFRIHTFKNGNAHLWFKREDLVDKVNKLIGEYYGSPIPEDRAPQDDGGLFTPKTTLAKNFGFYPTPDAAANRFFDDLPILQRSNEPALRILEPSAGTGALARRCVKTKAGYERYEGEFRFDNQIDCIEIQPHFAAQLRASGLYRRVIQADFLSVKPDANWLYDLIVMNPPFDIERDIDHVVHALQFLAPGGMLQAIMSAGTEFRSTKKSKAFRRLMIEMGGRIQDLPERSFSELGTNVNTIIVRVRKNPDKGSRLYWGREFEE